MPSMRLSSRKSGSFVPVNCGAIPETLMESEFFGHRKGAFTGAVIDKHGFLDLADGGTLFLDELGEIGQSMQVKLLRAIDGGGFTPIGGSQVKTPDLRIIAATNRDVAEQVRKGVIREDFFYRIHVIPIHLPSLRERKEDIPLLVEHFVEKFGKGKNLPPLTPRIMEALRAHDWPGNVRELQNTVFRYLTLKKLDFAGTVRRFGRRDAGPAPAGGGGREPGSHVGELREADHHENARTPSLAARGDGRCPGHPPQDAFHQNEEIRADLKRSFTGEHFDRRRRPILSGHAYRNGPRLGP